MPFKTVRDFDLFRFEVARKSRFVRSAEAADFLTAMITTCKARCRAVPAGHVFWRAQKGHGTKVVEDEGRKMEARIAHDPERMKPRRDRSIEGRANPKGIPYLYLSTTPDAAMSEQRPWIGALVSLARFRTIRSLQVIDLSVSPDKFFSITLLERTWSELESNFSPDVINEAVWAKIDTAFAEPTTASDDVADYAATQIIAEKLRSDGYDGVVYNSAFGEDAFSVALFNVDDAEQVGPARIHETKGAKFTFEAWED